MKNFKSYNAVHSKNFIGYHVVSVFMPDQQESKNSATHIKIIKWLEKCLLLG
jgi:hypothetical protein